MPKFSKTPEETVALFNECLPQDPRVQRRKMFGFPAAFVNDNLFTGTHEALIMVRLPPEPRAKLLDEGGTVFAPMGRPTKEYVCLPADKTDDDAYVAGWMDTAFAFVSAMPPKVKKPRKRKAAKKK